MPTVYSVAQYIADLRAIRATGSATAETSFYPPFASLLNSVGQSLKPAVLFSTQLRDSGAGIPDGGLFPQPPRRSRTTQPPPIQNPERGVVEIKPADYNLDTLSAEPQTLRYLRQYGIVLITNLRQFRLLSLDSSGAVRTLERYTLATTASDLWHAPIHSFDRHKDLLPDFLTRVLLCRAPLVQPKDVAWLLASYAREARARVEDHPLASFDAVKTALQESLGMRFEGERASTSSAPPSSKPSFMASSPPGSSGVDQPMDANPARTSIGVSPLTISVSPSSASSSARSPSPAHSTQSNSKRSSRSQGKPSTAFSPHSSTPSAKTRQLPTSTSRFSKHSIPSSAKTSVSGTPPKKSSNIWSSALTSFFALT